MPTAMVTPRLTIEDVLRQIRLKPPAVQQVAMAAFYRRYPHLKDQTPAFRRKPEDAPLYEVCRYDVRRFALAFFSHLCPTAFSPMHQDFFAQYATDAGARGLRDATAAPRSFAKTTVIGKIKILHDCVYQHERYIVLISSRDELAIDKVKDIRTELEMNTRLHEVYGPQVGTFWNMGDFITAQGVEVRAASRGSQVRGLLRGAVRPTKIVLDDSENSELVLTEAQRRKTWDWFAEDIAKLGDEQTNIEVIGTLLHNDSLLAKLLTNPGYRSRRYQAVLSFANPSAIPLWQQWRETFIALDNPTHEEDARAFFEAHQDAMLAGSAVLWPERYDYYRLMVERLVDGDASFFKERQNLPQRSGETLFAMEQAAYCTLVPDGLLRADGTPVAWTDIVEAVAFWDPTPDKTDVQGSDFASCAVVLRDRAGYCYAVDAYLAQESTTSKQIAGVVDLLWRWQIPIIGLEANGFQSLLASDLRAAIAQRAHEAGVPWPVDIWPVTNLTNKILRIKSLEPLVTNGWLQFARTLPSEALRQLADFLPVPGAGKVDYPDSLEGALRVTRRLLDRRSAA